MKFGRAPRATSRVSSLALPEQGFRALGPGVLAAVSFGFSDIFTKLALLAGMDALTLATYRGVLGTLFVLIVYFFPAGIVGSLRRRTG